MIRPSVVGCAVAAGLTAAGMCFGANKAFSKDDSKEEKDARSEKNDLDQVEPGVPDANPITEESLYQPALTKGEDTYPPQVEAVVYDFR